MKIPLPSAIHLLHECIHAVLATHSTQMPGFPYATAVPLVVDEQHRPLLLISALAEHTKNLLADSRASLAVTEPGQTNIQNAARMTLVGQFERCKPPAEIVDRYLRYQPEAGQYLQLDFMFFHLNIERVRFIGGVGKMGWLEAAEWHAASTIKSSQEAKLLSGLEKLGHQSIRVFGIDAYGVDYETSGLRKRLRFEPPVTAYELGENLPKLLLALS